MADYDLGQARGEIVIETDDRAGNKAAQALQKVQEQGRKLQAQLAAMDAKLRATDVKFRAAAAGANKFKKEVNDASAAVARADLTFKGTNSQLAKLQAAFVSVGVGAQKAGNSILDLAENALDSVLGFAGLDGSLSSVIGRIFELKSSFDKGKDVLQLFTTKMGLLKKVFYDLSGVDTAIGNLDETSRSVLRFSGIIVGVAGVMGAVGGKLRQVRGAILGLGVVSAIGSKFRALGAFISVFSGALAVISPRILFLRRMITGFSGDVGRAGQRFSATTRAFSAGIVQAARGLTTLITGYAVIRSGLTGITKAAKIVAIGLGGIGLAAGALQIVGTAVLGLVNALKQLSGILVILPGLILGLGTAGVVASVAFKGIGEAFKAGIGDASKFDEAIKNLPPSLQNVAKTVQGLKKPFKELKDSIQTTVAAGLAEDIQKIGDQYLPILRVGTKQVAQGLNQMTRGFTDFLKAPATQADTSKIFTLTGQSLNNLSKAIFPVISAFRDIGVVGLEVLTEISGGAGAAGKRFGEFISELRRTGELKQFIYDAIIGFKQLGSILADVGHITKIFFGEFGATGDNAIARLTVGMEKFRQKVDASARDGALDTIAATLRRMADQTFDTLGVAITEISDVLRNLGDSAADASNAFSGQLQVAIEKAGAVLQFFAAIINKIPGLAGTIGSVLGLAAGAKLLSIVLVPLIRSLRVLGGTFLLIKGAGTFLTGASAAITATGFAARTTGVSMGLFGSSIAALGTKVPIIRAMQTAFLQAAAAATTFGRAAGVAAAASVGVGAALRGIGTLLGGPFIAPLLAALAVFLSFQSRAKALAGSQAALAKQQDLTAQSTKKLSAAFEENNGILGEGVFTEVSTQLGDLRTNLDELAATKTGFGADLAAGIKDSFSKNAFSFDAGDAAKQNEAVDVLAQKAKNAATALNDLGLSNEELSRSVGGSEAEYGSVVSQLQAMGEWGRDAIEKLGPLRQRILDTKAAFAQMEPGAVALSNALEKIGAEGATSADKLDGLKSALSALGLIQQTATQAAFEYQAEIREVANANSLALEATAGFGDALLNADGSLKDTDANAYLLNNGLKELADGFLTTVSEGNNAQQAFDDLSPAIASFAEQTGLSEDKIKSLLALFGVIPDTITTIMSVQGGDVVAQELAQVLLKVQQYNGAPVNLKIDDQATIDALRRVGAEVTVLDGKTGLVRVTADAAVAQLALDQINAKRTEAGKPVIVDTSVPNAPATVGTLGVVGAAVTAMPKDATVDTGVPKAPATVGALGLIGDAAKAAGGTPVVVDSSAPQAPQTTALLDTLAASANEPVPEVTVETKIIGDGDVIAKLSSIQQACVDTGNQFRDLAAAVQSSMNSALSAVANFGSLVLTKFASLALNATNSGAALGQGFADGIRSKTTAVQEAALALAQAASAPLPNSPAKIGPFSGKGWTPFRGQALAEGFAQGIETGTASAQNASLSMAEQVAEAFKGLGELSATGNYNASLSKVGIEEDSALVDAILSARNGPIDALAPGFSANDFSKEKKYYRDTSLSDEDLRIAREERAYEKEQDRLDQLEEDAIKAKEDAEDFEPDRLKANEAKAEDFSGSTGSGNIVDAIGKLAKQVDPSLAVTSGVREGDPGYHGSGKAADVAGSRDAQLAYANFIADNYQPYVKELIFDDPEFNRNIKDGKIVQRGEVYDAATLADHKDHVHTAFDAAPNAVSDEDAKKIAESRQKDSIKAAREADTPLTPEQFQAITEAQNAKSDAEVVQALQKIDSAILTGDDSQIAQLQEVQDAVIEDRGIAEYDPFEGASTDVLGDVVKGLGDVFGLVDQIESAIKGVGDLGVLLERGFQNTDDVTKAIDGAQSIVSAIGSIASTVGSVVGTVASLAAAAGSAIPGIGGVAAGIGVLTGGISSFNGVIDLVQQGFKLAGRAVGGLMSSIAGGENGALYGNIRVLRDMNDGTIKRFSDVNPLDKRSSADPFSKPGGTNAGKAVGIEQANFYQGPGTDPYKMLDEAMFTIRANQSGAYAG